ncbi:alpha/beta hydrolase [Hymenobacter sp. BT190]|nr:alpha/beta hydrolase [Hymenobacter sp. BT190]
MFSVQNTPLDNARYPDLTWTSVEQVLRGVKTAPENAAAAADATTAVATDADVLGPYADEELIKRLPGFTNHYATVNGVRLHYVEGGRGPAVICLPGWPQTWYSYHPIAAQLAGQHRVIIVDIRGMGTSDKPASGYDKKTMAQDIYALMQHLGLASASLLGHDIGGMVATSFAAHYPEATEKLMLADGSHPSEGMMQMPLLPAASSFGPKMSGQYPYAWWMAFNQVKELPEQLLAGRFHFLLDHLFAYVMRDESKMTAFDRAVYAAVYNQPENIRASNAWYQAFAQDIEDAKTFPRLTMPVLGLGSNVAHNFLKISLPHMVHNPQLVDLTASGHYMFEEQPQLVLDAVLPFLE